MRYLARTYGDGTIPLHLRFGALGTARSVATSLPRGRQRAVTSRAPERPLELWSFEASPYCRKVREELTRLGLDYRVHNVGKRGRRRPELVALGGKMQVPYLVDKNTGAAMYESDDIIAYLRTTYG